MARLVEAAPIKEFATWEDALDYAIGHKRVLATQWDIAEYAIHPRNRNEESRRVFRIIVDNKKFVRTNGTIR